MCLKPQSPSPMASLRSLNPNAKPFYSSVGKIAYQESGFWQLYVHSPIPSTYPPSPAFATHHQSYRFEIYTPTLHVAPHVSARSTEQEMGSNPKRPPRLRHRWSHSQHHQYMKYPRMPGSRWGTNKRAHHHHAIIRFPTTMEEALKSRITTVMIKNIPYHFERENLLVMLDKHCVKQNASAKFASLRSKYDFVYLPMDYKKFAEEGKTANLGYAFVNFTTARGAFKFFKEFNGYNWVNMGKWKACEVTKAQFQGKELLSRFERKTFRCVCPIFRPVEYRPARDGANSEIVKEIWIGKYAEGLPTTSIGRSRTC